MEFLITENAPKAIGPYSQGTKANGFIFISGQLPINMETGELEKDPAKATKASLSNILEILKSGNGKIEDIMKINVYVDDINNFDLINKAYEDFFGQHKPARALVEVSSLPKGAIIEIEAIACVED